MRRVGTLTSACTMLALGLLLLADMLWKGQYFLSGLNFWPLVLVGIGVEILTGWLIIRHKRLPESLRLDGRALALLCMVGVFSVYFYSNSIKAQAPEVEPPPASLFTVTKKEVHLPDQVAKVSESTREIVLHNPSGKVEIEGVDTRELTVEATAYLFAAREESRVLDGLRLTPTVQFGETMRVTVPEVRTAEERGKATVDLKVRVPRGLVLGIESDHGDVTVKYYTGSLSIQAKAGNVLTDKLAGPLRIEAGTGEVTVKRVEGAVVLTLQQGDVTAEEIEGDLNVKVESGGSAIRNIQGALQLVANNGKVEIDTIAGNVAVSSKSGLLKVKDPQAGLESDVKNGDIEVGGKVQGPWMLRTTNGKVSLQITKDSNIRFLGETNKGVIKGPTKESPSAGTRQGYQITEQMGDGTHPVTVRSDNGSIFVEVKEPLSKR
jgi:DUF4097 and DUF4098 domain-containing protein YvlB